MGNPISGGTYIRKIILLILLLSAILNASSALETLNIGSGRHEVINLETGAKTPGYTPAASRSGFVTPPAIAPMALDPGALVSQAERYCEESRALYEESVRARDVANASAQEVQRAVEQVAALEAQVELYAKEAKMQSERSLQYKNETRDIYNETLSIYTQARELSIRLEELSSRASLLDNSTQYSLDGQGIWRDVSALSGSLLQLMQRLNAGNPPHSWSERPGPLPL